MYICNTYLINCFTVTLGLQKNCIDSTQNSCVNHTQFSLLLTPYFMKLYLSQPVGQHQYIVLSKVRILIVLPQFCLLFFSYCRSLPGSHITFSHHATIVSFNSFSDCPCFLMNLTVLRNTSQVFHKLFFELSLFAVFLTVRLGLWNFGRKTSEVKCHSHK